MKKASLKLLFSMLLFVMPFAVFADSEDANLTPVAETTKYYKTVTVTRNNDLSTMSANVPAVSSVTTEISKEEYDAVEGTQSIMTRDYSTTVETTYKMMTSTITQNGSYYRYKNQMNWKLMPSTRAFDIIGIGHLQSVKLHGNVYFTEEWSYTAGGWSSTSVGIKQVFDRGIGTSFALPSGDINSLKATMYFDVEKNTTGTIISQSAYADYSHETTYGLTSLQAMNYTVNQDLGIILGSSISSYYDSIMVAEAYWSGSW